MLKKITTSLVLMLVTIYGIAQEKLIVKILAEDKSVVKGASVNLNGKRSQTDENGIAIFTITNQQTNKVEVKHIGYQNQTEHLKPNQKELIIYLKQNINQTGEVYVFATRAKENSATTYKNISKEEIRKNNLGQDIPYLLDQTPGVIIGSDAGAGIGYTNMTIRGSDNQRINVTLNGIPLNDAESMGSFFVNLPDFASSVESIQIQRGIGTSTNGAGAFGASLNIQTENLNEKPSIEFNNSYGSYNSWKNTLKLGSGLIKNKYAFNTRFSNIKSDGYIDRASSDLRSFYIDAGIYTPKQTLKATVFTGKEKTYQAWYGTPEPILTGDKNSLKVYANEAFGLYAGNEYERLMNADRRYNYYTYDNQTDNYIQTHNHLQYTNILTDKLKLNTALHYTRGAGYYQEYRDSDKLSKYGIANVISGTDTISKTDLVRQRWLDNHFYGLIYSFDYKASDKWNFIVGGGYNQYLGDHYGKVIWTELQTSANLGDKYYLNEANKNDFNIYAKADYRTSNWLINMDLQYRNIYYKVKGNDDKIKNMNFKDNLNFINPKIGATYFLNAHANLYLSYAYASKEPVRKDYVENPRNEFPKPERMQDIELGYRYRNEKFNIGSNLYAMLYKDQLIPTGALNDTGAELRMNIPKSHRLGIEIDAAWKVTNKFTWSATAALSDNKIYDFIEYFTVYDNDTDWNWLREDARNLGNTKIAKSAAAILSNNLSYSPIDKFEISLLSKYVSRQYLDNTSSKQKSISPFFVNNIRAAYGFSAFGIDRLEATLLINNIFNEKYSTSGYTWGQKFENRNQIDFYNFYSPQATTNYLIGLNIKF